MNSNQIKDEIVKYVKANNDKLIKQCPCALSVAQEDPRMKALANIFGCKPDPITNKLVSQSKSLWKRHSRKKDKITGRIDRVYLSHELICGQSEVICLVAEVVEVGGKITFDVKWVPDFWNNPKYR